MKSVKKNIKQHEQFDVVIVGSGPAGVHAAYPLVRAGIRVAIIDGGLDSKKQDERLEDFPESNISKTSNAYDLIKKSSHVFNKTYGLLKIKSDIEIIQSLAKGGLSQVWHGICDFLSEEELKKIGLPVREIKKEYIEIANHINLKLHSPLDHNGRLILQSAQNSKELKKLVYELPLVFSYSTVSEIEKMEKYENFTYIPNQLVWTVKETDKEASIESFSIDKRKKSITKAKFLILAAGSINSTRIMLRSLNLINYKSTFLTKSPVITICLNPRSFLAKKISKIENFGQLGMSSNQMFHGLEEFFIQFYSFNSSALEKALKYIPLPRQISLTILSLAIPALVIADIRFPTVESKKRFCKLIKTENGKEILYVSFKETEKERNQHKKVLRGVVAHLMSLGLLPFKSVDNYVSAHYAGGIPIKNIPGKLSVDLKGKLHQGDRIYVADSSTWRALPAKAPTMTIMANASRVGKNVLKNFYKSS